MKDESREMTVGVEQRKYESGGEGQESALTIYVFNPQLMGITSVLIIDGLTGCL